MEKKILFFITFYFLIFIVSAQIPTLKLNETTNQTRSTYDSILPLIQLKNPGNMSIMNVNSSDFWDGLDDPTDIPESKYWLNHTQIVNDTWWWDFTSTYNATYEGFSSKADYQFTDNNFNGSGNYSGGRISLGTESLDAIFNIEMSSTDQYGVYVDGETNPYSNSGYSHAIRSRRYYDHGSGIIPLEMTANYFVSRHVSSNATVDASRELLGIELDVDMVGNISNEGATDRTFFSFPFYLQTTNTGTYDSFGAGYMKLQNRGNYVKMFDNSIFKDSSGTGNIGGVANTGGYFWIISNPTLSSGNAVFTNMGTRVLVTGTGEGWSTNYGHYIDTVSGADNNYGIYDASGANWILDADNQKIFFGETQNASIYFDGSDFIINPKEVGSGNVKMPGNLNVTGNIYVEGCIQYNCSDSCITLGSCL